MHLAYRDVLTVVQHLAPTWRKPQHEMMSHLVGALFERPVLCESEIARSLPLNSPQQSLHGRLKRLERFLSNPHLDEAALVRSWYLLSCRFGSELPCLSKGEALLPLLLDTTYFEPFAALVVSVPCGGRGLPLALCTYHRTTLAACLPPAQSWPSAQVPVGAPRQRQSYPVASAQVRSWLSQNTIEETLLDYVWSFLTIPAVVVADRGFARASLLRRLLHQQRLFVIRFDADTWLTLPDGRSGTAAEMMALSPGEKRWLPEAFYGKDACVPTSVLAVWEADQQEPWYLATNLTDPLTTETAYRWRMRIECANRDEKSGVLLRQGSDQHRLTSPLHLHRLLLALCTLHWLTALTGLQAYQDLPSLTDSAAETAPASPLDSALPDTPDPSLLALGPAQPPPVVPHRGPLPPSPNWLRRFVARGPLSYVRLGLEVLRSPDLRLVLHRLAHWLGLFLWPFSPLWSPRQIHYRRRFWWSSLPT